MGKELRREMWPLSDRNLKQTDSGMLPANKNLPALNPEHPRLRHLVWSQNNVVADGPLESLCWNVRALLSHCYSRRANVATFNILLEKMKDVFVL